MTELVVKENGKRLDAYISSINEEITRTAAQRLIEQGNILVNGKKQKVSYKVSVGDVITIEEIQPQEIELKAQEIPIEIIYEDNDIIVVNKPKGMVVHPANGNPDGTLVNAITAICKDSLSGIGGEIRPGIVHRLDKDTSGLLIVAKNDISRSASFTCPLPYHSAKARRSFSMTAWFSGFPTQPRFSPTPWAVNQSPQTAQAGFFANCSILPDLAQVIT